MKRMIAIITLVLVVLACLPAQAGTWREDFNVGDGFRWKGNPDVVATTIKNGFLDLKVLKPGWSFGFGIPSPSIPGSENWKDYALKMRMKFVDLPQGGIGTQGIELHVRINGNIPERYQVGFFVKHFNRANIATISKGVLVAPQQIRINDLISKDLPKPITKDVWYDLKVVTQGNNISFMVNQDFEISIIDKDNPFIKGGLMFMVDDAHVMIDYIEISGPDIPGLDLGVEPKSKHIATWGKIKLK